MNQNTDFDHYAVGRDLDVSHHGMSIRLATWSTVGCRMT
jgi:hypothetical protein